MLYPKLQFPSRKDRPYFYTNFVSTIDGKVGLKKNSKKYWPIGSSIDYQTLLELRAYADALVHGKKTALWHRTIDTLDSREFRKIRRSLGKEEKLPYFIVSNHPDAQLVEIGQKEGGSKPFLVTTHRAKISPTLGSKYIILPSGETRVDIPTFSSYLHKKGYRYVLMEGGPTLLGVFLSHNLIDEIFLTIAPKIFGNIDTTAFTMVEEYLFPAEKVSKYQLISVNQQKNELFLRYRA